MKNLHLCSSNLVDTNRLSFCKDWHIYSILGQEIGQAVDDIFNSLTTVESDNKVFAFKKNRGETNEFLVLQLVADLETTSLRYRELEERYLNLICDPVLSKGRHLKKQVAVGVESLVGELSNRFRVCLKPC